jgi:hypothetical protein
MGIARWTLRVAVVLIAAGAASVAEAQSNVCVDLEARLIQIDRGASSGGSNARQYDVTIGQQRNEIERATAEARRAGCMGGFLFFQKKPEAKCGKLMATIQKMQNNLQRLMADRQQFADDPYSIAQQRSNILRQLSQYRCGPSYASNDDTFLQPRQGGFLETLFGSSRLRTYDGAYSPDAGFGTYRTLCVRTCDGFYFPISFSTVPGQFNTDAATCQAMCPGAEAVLYTHRNPGEDSSQMVSLSGEPYASLPTAFRFRTEYDKTCTCHSATAALTDESFSDFSQNGAVDLSTGAPVVVSAPMPNLRQAAGEDPETIANRNANFVPKPVAPSAAGETTTTLSADGTRQIRVVGPAYYYGQ